MGQAAGAAIAVALLISQELDVVVDLALQDIPIELIQQELVKQGNLVHVSDVTEVWSNEETFTGELD